MKQGKIPLAQAGQNLSVFYTTNVMVLNTRQFARQIALSAPGFAAVWFPTAAGAYGAPNFAGTCLQSCFGRLHA